MKLLTAQGQAIGCRKFREGGFLGIGESRSDSNITAPTEKSPITASGASVAVRKGGAVFDTLGTGATQYRLAKNARVIINQTSDPNLLKDIVAGQNNTLEQFLSGSAESQSEGNKTLADVLGKLTDIAENKQTGGESGRNNTIAYLVLAALAVVALWLIFGRGK